MVTDDGDRYAGRTKQAVGARLELTRQALGLDQGEFARLCGLKANTYNQYERGLYYPSIASLYALRDRYRLTIDWILDDDPSGLPYDLGAAIAQIRRIR